MHYLTRRLPCAVLAAAVGLLPAARAAGAGERHLDGWLGAGVLDFDYEEFDPGGASLNREDGYLPGLNAGLRLGRGVWFAETALLAWSGRVDYTNPAVTSRTDEDILDWNVIAGRGAGAYAGIAVSAYAGLGYRHWRRDIHASPGANDGLDETYRWGYGLLGLRGERDLGQTSRVRGDLQLTRTLEPSIKIRFEAGYDDHTLDLGAANGVRAALTFEHRLDNEVVVFVSPWFEYWELGRSAVEPRTTQGVINGLIYEPDSETRIFGLNAGVRWRLF
jgi:hypothetical protein